MTSTPKTAPIQTQPQRAQHPANNSLDQQIQPPTDVLPSALDCLKKVEEVIFKDKVFQTRDGETLFSVRRETCSGPNLNLCLRDGYKKDVIRLRLISDDGGDPHLEIVALPMHPLGEINIDSVSGNLNISIKMTEDTSTYIASLPMFLHTQKSTSIEIFSTKESHQIAKVEKEGKSCHVVFQFSSDLETCVKTVILGAFLYLNFHLHELRRLDHSANFQDFWIIDCVDWENKTDSCSRPCKKPFNSDENKRDCCGTCLADCKICLCGFWDCVYSCAECCNCCLCSLIFLPCYT